ncbi:hypothetical protein ACHAPJ_011267 [Fusarium lateritium]
MSEQQRNADAASADFGRFEVSLSSGGAVVSTHVSTEVGTVAQRVMDETGARAVVVRIEPVYDDTTAMNEASPGEPSGTAAAQANPEIPDLQSLVVFGDQITSAIRALTSVIDRVDLGEEDRAILVCIHARLVRLKHDMEGQITAATN